MIKKRLSLLCLSAVLSVMTLQAQMLVGTYNIRYKNTADSINGNSWQQRCPVICQQINFLAPDIFGTQEAYHTQLVDLQAGLDGYRYIGVGRDDGKQAGEHSAIFYRTNLLRVLDQGNFWLSETPDRPGLGWDAANIRICTWGRFQHVRTQEIFYFFNLHMDHIGIVARREAARLVVSKIREIAKGSPVILTGDFNVDQTNEIYNIFTDSGLLKDCYESTRLRFAPNGTFNGFDPNGLSSSRIDHVFVSPATYVDAYGVMTGSYWMQSGERRQPSDHYPVFVRLSLSKQGERTTFQTGAHWKPATDIRSDLVMVYGANDRRGETFRQRVASWREHGYTTHFMTGIAWGEYQDYFTGKWDGKWHLDEGQKQVNGDTIWHGHLIPYIVPTKNYLAYFKERHIKPVIDAGISSIFLEEPEFWARSGYSDAFKREWQDYYGFPWRPQHESAENTYLSNKLKYHLYYRALDEAFTYAKQYGRERGADVKCYVPTHSLLNYAQWQIVSPEASLASMENCDGYIAQVWTGTAREPNFFNGVVKERTFETAYLEYGCMYSMVAPTHRRVYFLTDPIEDRAKDWQDYRRNYQATFTAQLLFPGNQFYEVMPWPDRIYEGHYRKSLDSDERIRIPRFYSTQMQVMINTLNDMPVSTDKLSGTQGVSILMSNSLMFQRSPQPVEGYDDPQLANFYGLALPLLKRGVPVNIVHSENTGYEDAWRDTRVLLMSYSNQKPMSAGENEHIARWVHDGGHLIYASRDDDPFQHVQEWWNQGDNRYQAPADHLFALMGIEAGAASGTYRYGKGTVQVIRQNPKEFVMRQGGDTVLTEAVRTAIGTVDFKNHFLLSRGAYELAAVLDEDVVSQEPLTLSGLYIDLFDPQLPVVTKKTVAPGEQAFLYNINKVEDAHRPQVLAAASRQYDEVVGQHSYSFTSKAPIETTNVMRVLLPKKPKKVKVSVENDSRWDDNSHTLWLSFENQPEGVTVEIDY